MPVARAELVGLYVDALRVLEKVHGPGNGRQTDAVAAQVAAHDRAEPRVLTAVRTVVTKARGRFTKALSEDQLTELLSSVHKSQPGDARKRLREILDDVFAGALAELVDSQSDLIDELARQFATVNDVDINFALVSEKAVDYLENHGKNLFTTLTNNLADGILQSAADALKSNDGYTIRDVAANVRDNALVNNLPLPDKVLDLDTWSRLVSRTETARAASAAQRSILQSIDLKTWQWAAQGGLCCDECDSNNGEIVEIGDAFPSGATEPPEHPNCRCVVTAVMSELDSVKDDESEGEESDQGD